MLNLLEKLQYGLSALVIIGAAALYMWQGTETRTKDDLKGPKLIPSGRPAAPARPGSKAAPPSPAPGPSAAEDRAILDRLAKEQNLRGKSVLEHKDYEVDKDTFSFVSREANWQPELGKASSVRLQGADGRSSRIQLNNIEEDSLFKKFGFEDNDIIEFIDGEKIDFDEASSMDHIQRWNRLKEKIQKGGKVSLTITRNGQPTQIEFKLGQG